MSQDVSSPYLDLWRDYEPEVYVEAKNAARQWAPDTTLTGCTYRVAATEQGAAIGSLTAIPAVHAAGAPGHYPGAIDLALLQSQLPLLTYPHGAVVYLQFVKPGDVDVEAFAKRIRRRKGG